MLWAIITSFDSGFSFRDSMEEEKVLVFFTQVPRHTPGYDTKSMSRVFYLFQIYRGVHLTPLLSFLFFSFFPDMSAIFLDTMLSSSLTNTEMGMSLLASEKAKPGNKHMQDRQKYNDIQTCARASCPSPIYSYSVASS